MRGGGAEIEEQGEKWRWGVQKDWKLKLMTLKMTEALRSPLFGSSQPCNEGRSKQNRLLGGEAGCVKVEGKEAETEGQKEGRTLNGEMMMLSVSDVNRSSYIVNRSSRLAERRAGPPSPWQ